MAGELKIMAPGVKLFRSLAIKSLRERALARKRLDDA